MEKPKNLKPSTILIYLDRDKLFLYAAGMMQLVTATYPDGVLVDLEVRKPEAFDALLQGIFNQSKLVSGQAYLLLSPNLLFEQFFAEGDPTLKQPEIDEFRKGVPFEHVKSRIFKSGKGFKIIATNRDITDILEGILGKLGFTLVAVSPASTLGLSNPTTLSLSDAKTLLKKTETLRENSLVEEVAVRALEEKTSPDPRKNKTMLLLISIFAVLAAVLGFLLFRMMSENQKLEKERQSARQDMTQPAPAAPANPARPVATTALPSLDLGAYKIQILNASGVTGQADSARKILLSAGFKDIETGNASTVNTGSSVISFSPALPVPVREKVISPLAPSFPGLTSRDVADQKTDIILTINKAPSASSSAGKTTP